jgi:hypothetical protein
LVATKDDALFVATLLKNTPEAFSPSYFISLKKYVGHTRT